jgi:hypothetical protein
MVRFASYYVDYVCVGFTWKCNESKVKQVCSRRLPWLPRYAQEYQLSTMQQVAACSGRAFKLHIRDKDNFVIPFTNQSIIQGLVIGSIFWQLNDDDFATKFSLLFMIVVQAFFFNLVSVCDK